MSSIQLLNYESGSHLQSISIIIATLSAIALIGLVEIPMLDTIMANPFPEQNCISNGGNGGIAGKGEVEGKC